MSSEETISAEVRSPVPASPQGSRQRAKLHCERRATLPETDGSFQFGGCGQWTCAGISRRGFVRGASALIAAAPLFGHVAACSAKPPLVPRQLFFEDPAVDNLQLSPDGQHIAFLSPLDGVRNLWIASLATPRAATPLTRLGGHGIGRQFLWAHTNRHLIFFQDRDGDENWRASSVNIETGAILPLTPDGGVRSFHAQSDRRFPSDMLFQHNARDRRFFDLYRINVVDGASELAYENREYAALVTDGAFAVRLGERFAHDGTGEYFERRHDGVWVPFMTVPVADADTTVVLGFSDDGNTLYMIDSRGRDKAALVAINMATRDSVVLVGDEEADIVDADIDPVTRRPLAALAVKERARWHPLDPAAEEDLTRLSRYGQGEIAVTSRSLDGAKLTAFFERDSASGEYALLDRRTQRTKALFKQFPMLDSVELRPLKPVLIEAQDGIMLNGYLTLPTHRAQGNGRPLVLAVHGGPYARDRWGFNPLHQWLANRGYAVLSVNYRGSTGFGKAFVAAADHEWGARMQDDLTSAVRWAIDRGIADADRIGIYGRSYGGYAALMAAVKSPDIFCCIVALSGMSNLFTFMARIPPYEGPAFTVWKERLGDPETEAGRLLLRERSPITFADQAVRPILIAQGLRDVRVPSAESSQMVAALSRRGVPVTYLSFGDEGHSFAHPQNRLALFAVVESFLARHLGGRCEPAGADLDGSTLRFETGRELIPGF